MEAARRAEFFKRLEADIREGDVETNLLPSQDDRSEILKALLPVTDEGDASLLEVMVADLVDEADILVFYTTMIAKIGPGYEDLLRALPQWNLECPLGAFGVYEDQGVRQLYHKYNFLFVPEIDPEELADTAMFHLTLLYEFISRQYKEARRISDGKAQPDSEAQPDGKAQPDSEAQPDGKAQPDSEA